MAQSGTTSDAAEGPMGNANRQRCDRPRPQVIAQQNFQAHREQLERLGLAERFRYIFDRNLWASAETHSGSGSTIEATEILRGEIPRLIRELEVQVMLDVPCGDFQWMAGIDLGSTSYIGADIVNVLVDANAARFGSTARRFLRLDLTQDALPYADLVLCRDCLVHVSYVNIRRALDNIRRSGATWVLMTSFLALDENTDIEDGDWRPLNFERAPFALPAPMRVIVENCREGDGAYADKALCLWRTEELRYEPPGAADKH